MFATPNTKKNIAILNLMEIQFLIYLNFFDVISKFFDLFSMFFLCFIFLYYDFSLFFAFLCFVVLCFVIDPFNKPSIDHTC